MGWQDSHDYSSKPGQHLLAVHPHNGVLLLCGPLRKLSLCHREHLLKKKRKKRGVLFQHNKRNNDGPPLQQKNTKLSRPMAHRAPVTVIRGTVPECNYRDNSCLIIQ